MTSEELLPLIHAVQAKRVAAGGKKPWRPAPDQWADPASCLAIPTGGAPRLWMHLEDFQGWRNARLALADAWPRFSGPPTKPVLLALMEAGELGLLNDASRRWPLRCSGHWCQKAFEQLLSTHYAQNTAFPMPLALGLADWVVERARAHPVPMEPMEAWSRLLRFSLGAQEEHREQALVAWWGRAHALGESPNRVSLGGNANTLLFLAVQKQMWALAERLVRDGANPNALIPQKGNALLTAIQKERAGTLTEPDQLVGLVYCMLDHGLDWQQPNPFPGQARFEKFLAPGSVLSGIDERWRALRRSEALEHQLPETTPSRFKPRF